MLRELEMPGIILWSLLLEEELSMSVLLPMRLPVLLSNAAANAAVAAINKLQDLMTAPNLFKNREEGLFFTVETKREVHIFPMTTVLHL
jgi:hypothetical protein